ncbi:MAG: AAA domain-containing protein, partial [Planctomycetia bacterium]|nr:AAA domain-containing protein [Planctomycetia bacterium]
GPPGTGKSQTITNIIAFALARGKRVLFVAEKKAALEVVQRRLEKIGLIPYCLELHSNRSTKKDVLDQLETAMQTAKTFTDKKFERERDRLDVQRKEIARYVEVLHRKQPGGKSLYELIALYEGIDDSLILKVPAEWSDWDSEAIAKRSEALERFCAVVQNIPHPQDHPLRAFRRTRYTQRLRIDVSEMLSEVSKSLEVVRDDLLAAQDFVMGTSIDSFDELKRCAEFLAAFVHMKDIPTQWLTLDELDQFFDRVLAFVDVRRNEERIEQEIRTVWPAAFLEMNGEELSAEYKQYYLEWPQNDPRERLPKSWFTERNRESFANLKQMAELGAKLDADAVVLACRWEPAFFKLDAKTLLAQWKELCLSISRSPVQTLPQEWFMQPDPETFLRSVDIACQCGIAAQAAADSLMLNWYKPFLSQDGPSLLEKVKKIQRTNFLFRFGAKRALINELLPWSRQNPTMETVVSGIEQLCNYQEQKERAQRELSDKEQALKRYVCADGYDWNRMRSDCGLALSLLAEIKSFAPLWSAREAFLSNLALCTLGKSVDPSIVEQSLDKLVEYQDTEKERQWRLSQNQLDLASFCQSDQQGRYDWSRVQASCDTVLSDWDAFCSWADELPGKAAFARKFNAVLPASRSRHVVETGLRNLIELQRLQREDDQAATELAPLLTSFDTGGNYDYDRITTVVSAARCGYDAFVARMKTMGKQADVNEYIKRFAAITERPCWFDIEEHWNRFDEALRRLFEELEVDTTVIVLTPDYPARLAETLVLWSGAMDELRSWIQCCLMTNELNELGLDFLTKAWYDGLATSRLRPVFHKNLYRLLITKIFDECAELNQFSGDAFEKTIEHFRQCEAKWTTIVMREILATVSARIPDFTQEAANGSEPGILRRAIRGRGRGTSIRHLFERVPNLLARLCPCMLMSPISVAQYLSPELKPFDLIVFDEASQMPTCKAVGALARGTQAVIVGDPRQLPPTNFFSTNSTDEDNFEMEDLDSILDDCLALSLPETHLRWHYRSRHESLIAFSNNEYYDGGLLTFPSANDNASRVSLVHVPGYYDRGHSRTNVAEAHAVVAEVRRRLSDPTLAHLSIGVVTFSAVQQNLVDDLLSELFKREPDLETIATGGDEPLFVKN